MVKLERNQTGNTMAKLVSKESGLTLVSGRWAEYPEDAVKSMLFQKKVLIDKLEREITKLDAQAAEISLRLDNLKKASTNV